MISDLIMTIGMSGIMKTSKRKNILILGANGMLGSMVYFYFVKFTDHKIIGTYNKKKIYKKFIKFDAEIFISKNNKYEKLFNKVDYVINCIGLIKPDTINNTRKAIEINSLFPHVLNNFIKNKCLVFQIKTDCVFSGHSKVPYFENCDHDALDVYGKSKSLGEVSSNKFINIRTSIIGPEPSKHYKSLFEWFIAQKSNIDGFTNHYWNGITTYDFARVVSLFIKKGITKHKDFHISYVKKTNKYDLLKKINKIILKNKKKVYKLSTKNTINRILDSNNKELNKKIANHLYKKNNIVIEDMLNDLNLILINYYKFYQK